MVKQIPSLHPPDVEPGWTMPSQAELKAEADRLYGTYVKPLEQEHWGSYVVVAPDGRLVVGDSRYEVTRQATEAFGLGNFGFKVGERIVGRIRCMRDSSAIAFPSSPSPSQSPV